MLVGDQDADLPHLLRVLVGRCPCLAGVVVGGPQILLTRPPGEEWNPHDLVTDALGAPHLVGREMGAMSAGERQRARVANALAAPVAVVLLEEPLSLLDAPGRQAVWAALRTAADAGRAIVVVDSIDQQAATVADRVITLT